MTSSIAAPRRPASRWVQWRGLLAGLTVVGFFGVAVVAPFTTPGASADAEFQQRIHQRFVPENVADPAIDLTVSPLVAIPTRTVEAPAERAAGATAAPPMYAGGGSPAEWMAAAGIPKSDWGYVDYVISRESSWNPNATNASSGACGLAQALPCSKVPGNGYDPVDNLRWADGYAKGRYGSWAGAYDAWIAQNWW